MQGIPYCLVLGLSQPEIWSIRTVLGTELSQSELLLYILKGLMPANKYVGAQILGRTNPSFLHSPLDCPFSVYGLQALWISTH